MHRTQICLISEEVGTDGEMLGGLTASVSLPSLFRLPIELLTLCTLCGAVNLFSGTLLLSHVYTMHLSYVLFRSVAGLFG